MKKIIAYTVLIMMYLYVNSVQVFAQEDLNNLILNDMKIQNHIDNIGYKILNANKINERMIFVYKNKSEKINLEPGLTKRQIVVYDKFIQFASDDSEIGAILAREIAKSAESYSGGLKGLVSSAQVKCAPKKYEIFFDKRAVDYLVTAGYNPIALITYINKAYPQKRYDKFGRTNLTSKRLARIYEYIYTKYPIYLVNNEYLETEAYQNFLLTSAENRKKLAEKIKSGSKADIDYE